MEPPSCHVSKRIRLAAIFICVSLLLFVLEKGVISIVPIPAISLDHPRSPYNASKLALLIEDRPNPVLAPLMLHFMAVVPPEWRFRFMGSAESVDAINRSVAIQQHVRSGKLDLTLIPENMSTADKEMISRFLTTLWLYETALHPAEWLLIFQTDSILCANSRLTLNDFLEYDWVGAPWDPNGRWGGNGGLSLRRVSRIIEVLRNQQRADDTEPEDVWLAERLGHNPHGKVANGTVSLTFSGETYAGVPEHIDNDDAAQGYDDPLAARAGAYIRGLDDWRDGFYEPMGYHTGGGGASLHSGIWGSAELRRHIWRYCPEVKMTLAMDLEQHIPGNCMSNWKRHHAEEEVETGSKQAFGTDEVDGADYPLFLERLMPR